MPTHDGRPDVVVSLGGEVVVESFLSAGEPDHGTEGLGGLEPIHDPHRAVAERLLKSLVWTSAVTVHGYGKASDDEFWHLFLLADNSGYRLGNCRVKNIH